MTKLLNLTFKYYDMKTIYFTRQACQYDAEKYDISLLNCDVCKRLCYYIALPISRRLALSENNNIAQCFVKYFLLFLIVIRERINKQMLCTYP